MKKRRDFLAKHPVPVVSVSAAAVAAADLALKSLALGRFETVCNSGTALGWLPGGGWLLALGGVLSLWIAYSAIAAARAGRPTESLLWSLLLGGGAANLAERLSRGCVTDFLDFFGLWRFNPADAAITLAVAGLLALLWRKKRGGRRVRPVGD
ncbi:MAG TPA: signal peptidase II [Candidatus Moranbacteria bacterium]|nr:signal peptidase II [Candidatus Moranbacteria bacterium]